MKRHATSFQRHTPPSKRGSKPPAATQRRAGASQGRRAQPSSFKVHVEKDYLKFNAAHFIAHKGFREALHGHNYRVSVEVEGELDAHGYVLDFGVVKRVARRVCQRLDEKTLFPAHSDCLEIRTQGPQIIVRYESDEFSLPQSDALLLPIVHTSAEELARYLAGEIRRELHSEGIEGIQAIEIGVEETPGQAAYYRDRL